MKVLYCWDGIEHLAARQIDSMLQGDENLSFVIATKFVSDDAEVEKILLNDRIKLFNLYKTKNQRLNVVLYFLMYFWIFISQKFDLIDVKMAQSKEMKNIFLLNKLFNKEYILNMLGKERHIEDDGFFLNKEKHQIIKHIKNAKRIVCVDQTLVDLALKYRDDKENIIKLWNSQDVIAMNTIDKNEIKEKYNIKNKKVILFNHRLLKSKRPFLFFEFVEKILNQRNDIIIIIVSTIKEQDVALKMIELYEKYEDIIWLGKDIRLNFEELKEIFAISDVGINIATLVCPSLATLEAMAAGVPQVISNEIDSDAYVIDGFNGFVLDKLDPDELLEKVKIILDDDNLRNMYSVNCKVHVKSNFSQVKWSKTMLEIYNDK